jgi:hypothetical protein
MHASLRSFSRSPGAKSVVDMGKIMAILLDKDKPVFEKSFGPSRTKELV